MGPAANSERMLRQCEGKRDDEERDGRELQIDVQWCFGATELGLRRCLPFEQMFARHEAATQRPNDRIEREQHVVGQEGEVEDVNPKEDANA
jgi:hypothetical protein